MRFAASRSKPAPIYARGNIKWRQWSSHSNAICNQRFKNRIELRTQEQPLVAKHTRGTIRAWNDPSRNRRTNEVPFIAGCSHFTRKNTRFRAPASSPKHSPCNIHAAMTCVSQHPVANLHLSTHVATSNDDNDSHSNAICNQRFKNRIELRTEEQPLVAKHIGGTIRAWNDPSRNRRTHEVPFIAGCSHFTRKNTRFRAPASSPKHSPCNIHAAMTMRFAASRSKPAPIYTRGNIKWRQWSSHSNAICNQRFKNRIELRTQEQPLFAKHIGGTIRAWNDPSRNRRTHEVPFIAGCSHFTRKNTRFRAPASSPKHSPCNIHAAMTMRFPASRSKPAPIYARGNINWRQWSSHSNAICNQRFKNRIELRTQEQPLVAKHIGGTIRAWNDPSRNRRTHAVPFIAGCNHFTRKNSRFRAPASSPTHSTCNPRHHFPSSPLSFLTTAHRYHFPSSPPPFVHFPSSPLPFLTNSHRPHLPSSPLPFIITALPHHFPSSPIPIVPTSLPHHSPSSSLPFVTISLRHHFPSSPHHFPSSPLPIVTSFLWLCIVRSRTTLHHSQFQTFLFFCDVYCSITHHPSVLLDHAPPFTIVNSIASYSFVMYC